MTQQAVSGTVDRIGRNASTAVFMTFLLSGLNFSSWAARLPAVQDGLGLSKAEVGILLLVGAIGSLVALPLSGLVIHRLGTRRTVEVSAVLNVVGLFVAATGVAVGQVWLSGLGLVVYGAGTGVWDASMNVEGAAVEQRLRRSIMPRYHAGFSLGTIGGGAIAAGAAALHVPVATHLGVVLAASLVVVLLSTRHFLTDEPAHTDEPGTSGRGAFNAWGESRTLLVGLVVLGAALTEGAANDWVALAVVDDFGTTDATGALAFTVFVTAMTGMRLLGTRLIDRWGRVAVLRLAAALSLVGLLVFGLVPWLWLAVVGIVLWGAGAALGFPVGMSAAADDPRRAPARVAVVSTIGYSAFLAGPPLLGLLAEQVGYRSALLAVAIPVLVGLLVVPAARPLPGSGHGRQDDSATGLDPAVSPPQAPLT